jgi:hypothetical protein
VLEELVPEFEDMREVVFIDRELVIASMSPRAELVPQRRQCLATLWKGFEFVGQVDAVIEARSLAAVLAFFASRHDRTAHLAEVQMMVLDAVLLVATLAFFAAVVVKHGTQYNSTALK